MLELIMPAMLAATLATSAAPVVSPVIAAMSAEVLGQVQLEQALFSPPAQLITEKKPSDALLQIVMPGPGPLPRESARPRFSLGTIQGTTWVCTSFDKAEGPKSLAECKPYYGDTISVPAPADALKIAQLSRSQFAFQYGVDVVKVDLDLLVPKEIVVGGKHIVLMLRFLASQAA